MMASSGSPTGDRDALRFRDDETTLFGVSCTITNENSEHLADLCLTSHDPPDNVCLDKNDAQRSGDYIHHRDHHLHSVVSEAEKLETDQTEGGCDEKPLYVEFEMGDKRDPANFSPMRKRAILLTGCLFAFLTGQWSRLSSRMSPLTVLQHRLPQRSRSASRPWSVT